MDLYLKALLVHIRETAPLAKGYQVDTIYFGGGTPSYFGKSGCGPSSPSSGSALT